MADIRLVPAEIRHATTIANRMRAIDRLECTAMGSTPKAALRRGCLLSTKAWTALVDGRPEAMFGVVVTSALTGQASPWFLGTNEVYRQGRALLRWGPAMVARLCDSTRRLSNLVSADNRQAIRLLRFWGFDVHEEPIEVGGLPFYMFEKVSG